MFRRTGLGFVVVTAILAATSRADLIVTLEPKDTDGEPITGEIEAGAEVVVDILISVDGDDVPLADLVSLQFDFGASSPALEIGQFVWDLDSAVYGLLISTLPAPVATSRRSSRCPAARRRTTRTRTRASTHAAAAARTARLRFTPRTKRTAAAA